MNEDAMLENIWQNGWQIIEKYPDYKQKGLEFLQDIGGASQENIYYPNNYVLNYRSRIVLLLDFVVFIKQNIHLYKFCIPNVTLYVE